MVKIRHTTVILTEKAQEIKNDLAPVFGLKNVLSAGLVLFGRLSDSEQKDIIREANLIERARRAALEAEEIVSGAEADATRPRRRGRPRSVKSR